ncbi:MAG: hypothetical protein NT029_08370 [Armatimonadetes bacterium]|nr:hypothetical protein [Armatimonadota bacterium]
MRRANAQRRAIWCGALVVLALAGCTDKRNETYGPPEPPRANSRETPMAEGSSVTPMAGRPSAAPAESRPDAAPKTF